MCDGTDTSAIQVRVPPRVGATGMTIASSGGCIVILFTRRCPPFQDLTPLYGKGKTVSRGYRVPSTLGAIVLSGAVALSSASGCRDRPVPVPQGPSRDEVRFEPQAEPLDALPVAPGALQSPIRIALGGRGRLFVSDYNAETIVAFKARRGRVFSVGGLSLAGRPLGVAAVKNQLIVGNATAQSVDVYRIPNGKRLYTLAAPGTVTDPTDIAVDARLRLVFVLDGRGKSIKVFSLKERALVNTLSGPGLGAYDLQNPTGIAVDPTRREVLVSDYGKPGDGVSPSIKIFTYDGYPVKRISGKAGMLGQRFSRPQGLAVDAAGRILMVDALAGEVQVLDRETGGLVETLGSFGSGPGELWLPLDVVVGLRQKVYVTNNRPRRVEVFSLGGPAQ